MWCGLAKFTFVFILHKQEKRVFFLQQILHKNIDAKANEQKRKRVGRLSEIYASMHLMPL